ncbi:MAG: hypothetical protein V1834_03455 [Candidatus Micrarchaeota archaeon]
MRLKGMIFTIDGLLALAFLIAASLMVLTFYHAPFEDSKLADVQQLGFDYVFEGSPPVPVGFDFGASQPGISAFTFDYPQETSCVNPTGPDTGVCGDYRNDVVVK